MYQHQVKYFTVLTGLYVCLCTKKMPACLVCAVVLMGCLWLVLYISDKSLHPCSSNRNRHENSLFVEGWACQGLVPGDALSPLAWESMGLGLRLGLLGV